MRTEVDYAVAIFRASDLFKMVVAGRLGLPDFQRQFEWSSNDVKAFLSTVLGGLPSGSLMVADNRALSLVLRPLEGAPPIVDEADAQVILDGQQRLTALFQAALGFGPYEYLVDFTALLAGADVIRDDVVVSRRRSAFRASERMLVPCSALLNSQTFFGWLNSTKPAASDADEYGRVFASQLHAIDEYRIPVTKLGGSLSLATVAQVFERTNKWGQRLDAFDLLVARVRAGGWALRDAWNDTCDEHPEISRVFGGNGLTAVAAVSLLATGDVRRDAVLDLSPGRIESEWPIASRATADVARLLLREGVRKPELLSYSSVATAMIAARMRGVSETLLARYYWLATVNRWHEVASNTRAASDIRFLLGESLDPSIDRMPIIVEDVLENTRRSNRALWAGIVSAILVGGPRDLVTGESVSSALPEDIDQWVLVPFVGGSSRAEGEGPVPLRLRTVSHLVSLASTSARLRRSGLQKLARMLELQPSLFGPTSQEVLDSQLMPTTAGQLASTALHELLRERSQRVSRIIATRAGE